MQTAAGMRDRKVPFQWTLVPCTLVHRNLHLSQTCCNTAELYILIICGARQNEVELCCQIWQF